MNTDAFLFRSTFVIKHYINLHVCNLSSFELNANLSLGLLGFNILSLVSKSNSNHMQNKLWNQCWWNITMKFKTKQR